MKTFPTVAETWRQCGAGAFGREIKVFQTNFQMLEAEPMTEATRSLFLALTTIIIIVLLCSICYPGQAKGSFPPRSDTGRCNHARGSSAAQLSCPLKEGSTL